MQPLINRPRLSTAVCAAFALLSVVACGEDPGTTTTSVTSADASEPLTVTFGADEIDAPAQLPTGLVTFDVRTAQASEESQIQLFRLDDATEPAAFFEAMATGDLLGVLEIARPAGGINLKPGDTTELTVELDAARYVFLDPDSGVVSALLAAAGESNSTTGAVDGVVKLRNFEITLPSDFGVGTYAVESTDTAVHGLTLVKLDDGVTLDEVRLLLSTDADLPGTEVVRAGNLGPGTRQILRLDLAPGHYLAASYFPDLDSGSTQASLGMVAEFTVEG